MRKEMTICGETIELHYGDISVLDVELMRIGGKVKKSDGYHAIELRTKKGVLLRLHIKEAMELKAAIESLTYDALAYED